MLSFGDTALAILDTDEFKKRIFEAAQKENMEAHFGKVYYFDESIDGGNLIISLLRGMWNIAFWKRKRYTYQQESRFVFKINGEKKDHLLLDIGDISDISKVVSAKTILDGYVKKGAV